jgi:hypothetical protein
MANSYILLTRSLLNYKINFVQLACVKHNASVHPEPGSNSFIISKIIKKVTKLMKN